MTGKLTDAENRGVVEESQGACQGGGRRERHRTRRRALDVSADGRTAYATMVPSTALGDLAVADAEAILDTAAEPAAGTGVQVEAGGQLGTRSPSRRTRRAN